MSVNAEYQHAAVRPAVCRELRPRMLKYNQFKRVFDILGASVLLLLLFPVFLVIGLLVKLTSKGPVLYFSERVGLCGAPFKFYKFRSMYVDADKRIADLWDQNEKDGPIFKMKNDPRVTKIGRILRRYSLDELPQLINVVKGEMSLVGPRPALVKEVQAYGEFEAHRLTVRPGITCYWQIMGRSDLSFQEWMELDHRYIKEMSFATDLKILFKTPVACLKGDGAY